MFLCGLLLAVVGCERHPGPDSVATAFWKAAVSDNSLIMKRLSSKKTYTEEDDFSMLHNVNDFELGAMHSDSVQAEIATTLHIHDRDQPVVMMTYLLREDAQWRIDYQRSVQFLTMNADVSALIDDIEALAKNLAEQVQGSIEQFRNKALPEIRARIDEGEKEFRQQLPEIKQNLERFLDELERSLQDPATREAPATTET